MITQKAESLSQPFFRVPDTSRLNRFDNGAIDKARIASSVLSRKTAFKHKV
ncbi:MAG: hypothetical protein ACTIOO_01555 [Pseudolactococcus laudensis]